MQTFWRTAELTARGRSKRDIAEAKRLGTVQEVRTGVVALRDAPKELVRAVRVGGIATAHTAARSLGLWTPPDDRSATRRRRPDSPPVLRVAVPSTTRLARLHDPDDAARILSPGPTVQLFWTPVERLRPQLPIGRADLLLMLEHLFRVEEPERALAVVDSALHLRFLRVRDLHVLADRLPAHLRRVVLSANGDAESGIETIVRFRLLLLGLRLQLQFAIPGVGRVDLLVEGRLIVECDGLEWHDGDEAFERDRTRDVFATIGRYRVLRLSWFRVLFQWEEAEAAVLAALAA